MNAGGRVSETSGTFSSEDFSGVDPWFLKMCDDDDNFADDNDDDDCFSSHDL